MVILNKVIFRIQQVVAITDLKLKVLLIGNKCFK